MASDVLSTDIYDISSIVESIKKKYTNIDEDTLALGIYGYLNEMHSYILENATVMASEYSNEAIPIKSKFERNIICHAVSLGINKIRATPAYMPVLICLPEDSLVQNMTDDKFVLDKESILHVGQDATQYEYHVDYDIIIKRNLLPNGKYVFTAMYDIDGRNEVATNITSPYLPTIGVTSIGNTNLIILRTYIRQITHSKIYKKIIVTNPLENKTINFAFENQLAYFMVEVVEGDKTHWLECVYDGLYATDGKEYCNYMYIDEKNIRIKFNRDSYQPRSNCEVTVHIYTTLGATCNFDYSADIQQNLESERFSYNAMYAVIRPTGNSQDGTDKMTVEEIKSAIPRQMLMRDSVTTYTDLNNYFNAINSSNVRLYFLEKVHNQEERLFYSYLLLKSGANIVPTNTMDVEITRDMFANINKQNYVVQPGASLYYNGKKTIGIPTPSDSDKAAYEKSGFLYMNPFLTVINKNPFFVAYYMNILDYTRTLDFEYINTNSEVQFICGGSGSNGMTVKRLFFTDRNTYKITVDLMQNITSDFDLVTTDENGNITSCNIKVLGVVYIGGIPYRYTQAKMINYDDSTFIYTFELEFTTNDIMDKDGKIAIESGMYAVNSQTQFTAYLPANVEFKFFMLGKFDKEYGRSQDIDAIVPGLDGYTLCNVYKVDSGVDLYYDYSNIVGSYITLKKNDDGTYNYYIKKMPLVRYTYLNTEARMKSFLSILEKRRLYIESCLILLEDSFGIDFKFFNTYGPTSLYTIDGGDNLNRINLSLTFDIKYKMPGDAVIQDEITAFIKDYLEDITDIGDFHATNLTTAVETKFSSQVVYIQLVDLNGYGNDKQNIVKQSMDAFLEANTVPEFINVNTKDDESADITYHVIP